MAEPKRQRENRVRLKRDIVIKTGTILGAAPLETLRCIPLGDSPYGGHYQHTIAMGKDNSASLVVFLERDAETAEWLEPVE